MASHLIPQLIPLKAAQYLGGQPALHGGFTCRVAADSDHEIPALVPGKPKGRVIAFAELLAILEPRLARARKLAAEFPGEPQWQDRLERIEIAVERTRAAMA